MKIGKDHQHTKLAPVCAILKRGFGMFLLLLQGIEWSVGLLRSLL